MMRMLMMTMMILMAAFRHISDRVGGGGGGDDDDIVTHTLRELDLGKPEGCENSNLGRGKLFRG